MKRKAMLTVIMILTFLTQIYAQDKIALTLKSRGEIALKRSREANFKPNLAIGTPLFSEDHIKTGNDGYAVLVFLDDKSQIKIRENSEMIIRGQRGQLVQQIPLRYIREYERVAKARNGLAVVSIKTDYEEKLDKKGNLEYIPLHVSCGGCHKIVPPQKVVEIKSGRFITRCESCGRILYFDQGEFRNNDIDEENLL